MQKLNLTLSLLNPINLLPLVSWFRENKRDLPWRRHNAPYFVWVSEIMLQQTQVKTVIPYFERWIELFPTIESLANASEEVVIKAWEGLGYYSRARSLHQGAKMCVENFDGELPSDPEKLERIKGIGPYTKGAILSFAFHQKAAAIDGNVLRVISRLLGSKKDISLQTTRKYIESQTLEILPANSPWEAMEALIELGALICNKNPACFKCPLNNQCKAFKENLTTAIPIKSKKIATTFLTRHALLMTTATHVLLKKGVTGKVMDGLWEFPYFEDNFPKFAFGYDLAEAENVGKVKHGFTRFQVDLHGWRIYTEKQNLIEDYVWVSLEEIHNLPFSSGMKKLLNKL